MSESDKSQKDRIDELERRVRDLELRPVGVPVPYPVPYYPPAPYPHQPFGPQCPTWPNTVPWNGPTILCSDGNGTSAKP